VKPIVTLPPCCDTALLAYLPMAKTPYRNKYIVQRPQHPSTQIYSFLHIDNTPKSPNLNLPFTAVPDKSAGPAKQPK
jgi:hypothetical protein